MKVITQKEFDNFPAINSCKQCPSGDYTQIKKFEDDCSFGENCKFGKYSEFGKRCSFGEHCEFDNGCNFGEYCEFRRNCSFGDFCEFGNDCYFREECTFGLAGMFGGWCLFNTCKIGKDSSFGECCVFEGKCIIEFEEKCIIENEHITKNKCPLLIFSGFGSVNRTTYFFNCTDGIWVRCGCFFGDIEQFRERVKQTRKGKLGKEYLMIADLVEMKWK